MSVTLQGTIVYGVPKPKPLAGFPDGRIRLLLRHDAFGKVFVRTVDGLRVFHIKDDGDAWIPGAEIGRNAKGHAPAE